MAIVKRIDTKLLSKNNFLQVTSKILQVNLYCALYIYMLEDIQKMLRFETTTTQNSNQEK